MDSEQNNKELGPAEIAARTEEFVRLFSEHQQDLFKFIFLLVPNRPAAEDIMQETSVVLWRKFGEFQPGTDFFRWAAQVARFKIRDFRKAASRDRHRFWSDELVQSIADTRLDSGDLLVRQRTFLADCLRSLPVIDRELIRRCYGERSTIKYVAEQLGRPVNTVYKALNRIRKTLMDCVEKAQHVEEHRS